MQRSRGIFFAPFVLALALLGCASSANMNPPAPRANTGYADFYSPTDAELCWDVRDAAATAGNFKTVFSDVEPAPGDVLRLAFTPGRHKLRVTVLNRVITKPADIEVQIENGGVTPIRVTLTEAGSTFVQSKERSRGNTFYGRAGRRTKISSEETVMYDISATADPTASYLPKEQMSYLK
jgi:hypothetical protein